jgi:hypothetical protein
LFSKRKIARLKNETAENIFSDSDEEFLSRMASPGDVLESGGWTVLRENPGVKAGNQPVSGILIFYPIILPFEWRQTGSLRARAGPEMWYIE